jgi:replicative DNA helicase
MAFDETLIRAVYGLVCRPVPPSAEEKASREREDRERMKGIGGKVYVIDMTPEEVAASNARAVERNRQELIRRFPSTAPEVIDACYRQAEEMRRLGTQLGERAAERVMQLSASQQKEAQRRLQDEALQSLRQVAPGFPEDLHLDAFNHGVMVSFY